MWNVFIQLLAEYVAGIVSVTVLSLDQQPVEEFL